MNKSAEERIGPEGIPEVLPAGKNETHQNLQEKLADFILHLTQAFLRTGYYTPEHPESMRAKEGLYQHFQCFFEQEGELTFLVREEGEKKEILVEGILPEASKLSRMMAKGMGELYIPRLAKYLERKDLISLSLKSRMEGGEFARFVDVMSEPSLVDIRRKEDKERFAQTLIQHEIVNVSLLFDEELLAPTREMPWRARLMLSRMRKDLKMIPYFQKMSGGELQEIRKKLIQDGVRPIQHPDFLCAVLQNSDLAATDENSEEIIENGILASIRPQQFLETAGAFLKEHLAIKQLQKKDALEAKSDRLILKLSVGLKETGTQEAEDLLEEFFRQQLIDVEDLPPRLKDKVLVEKATDKFLKYTDFFLQQFDQTQERDEFLSLAYSFAEMLPELIRRDRYSEVLRILDSLKRHSGPEFNWASLAGQVLEEIGKGTTPALLKEKFLAGKKEVRIAIVPIFQFLGPEAIPHLLAILKTSEDQWVRKNAGEALIQIGPAAISHLLKEMEEPHTSDETVGDILRILGEIKSPKWKGVLVKILEKYVPQENPRLRELAIQALCLVGGTEGEDIFLSRLDDPALEVRKKAIWCLGMVKSLRGAEKMMAALKQTPPNSSEEFAHLETQIYHAFGTMGNLTLEGVTLEQILLNRLDERGIKKWGGLFQKNPLTDSALGAIGDALGKMGTEKSVATLRKLGKSQGGAWVARMEEVIKKIEKRAGAA